MKRKGAFIAVFFTIFLLMGINVSAQDVITLKNGDELEVRIIELTDDYVIYYHIEDPNQVEVKMNRSLIRKIEYEYGRKEEEVEPGHDENFYVDDKRRAAKFNFTSIGGSVTNLTYEHSFGPTSGLEADVIIHGLGVNNDEDRSGFGVGVAYKIKMGSIFKKYDYRPNHLLEGTYFRPNIGYNAISFDSPSGVYDYNTTNYFHGGLDFGKQWVFNNLLLLDIFAGYHYYGGTFEIDDSEDIFLDETIADGFIVGANNNAFKYGIRVGVVF